MRNARRAAAPRREHRDFPRRSTAGASPRTRASCARILVRATHLAPCAMCASASSTARAACAVAATA
eukprot:5735239-Pleurochrysis_carterae.AAC.1